MRTNNIDNQIECSKIDNEIQKGVLSLDIEFAHRVSVNDKTQLVKTKLNSIFRFYNYIFLLQEQLRILSFEEEEVFKAIFNKIQIKLNNFDSSMSITDFDEKESESVISLIKTILAEIQKNHSIPKKRVKMVFENFKTLDKFI